MYYIRYIIKKVKKLFRYKMPDNIMFDLSEITPKMDKKIRNIVKDLLNDPRCLKK